MKFASILLLNNLSLIYFLCGTVFGAQNVQQTQLVQEPHKACPTLQGFHFTNTPLFEQFDTAKLKSKDPHNVCVSIRSCLAFTTHGHLYISNLALHTASRWKTRWADCGLSCEERAPCDGLYTKTDATSSSVDTAQASSAAAGANKLSAQGYSSVVVPRTWASMHLLPHAHAAMGTEGSVPATEVHAAMQRLCDGDGSCHGMIMGMGMLLGQLPKHAREQLLHSQAQSDMGTTQGSGTSTSHAICSDADSMECVEVALKVKGMLTGQEQGM